MELQLKLIGALLLMLSLIHIIFPRYFAWKAELIKLSLINRQIVQVHTFFIALMLFLMGLLCISSAHELINTLLGKRVLWGMGIFWLCRLLIQFFGYSPVLWKGKRFETMIHIVFSALWIYITGTFFYILAT